MKNISINLRKADMVGAVLFIIFSIAAFYATTTWIPPVLPGDPGAAFFPQIALIVILIFSALLLLQSFRKKANATDDDPTRARTVNIELSGLIATIAYSGLLVAGIAFAQFEISVSAFLAYMLGIRTGRWVWAAIVALISMVLMYFSFIILLKVRLPLLFLPEYLGF